MNGQRAYFDGRLCVRIAPALCLVGLALTGCVSEPAPTQDDDGDLVLGVREYVDLFNSLDLVDEYNRIARSVPDYLLDVPGVDGEGPFEVETISDVPFRLTPTDLLTVNVFRPITTDGKLRRAVVAFMGGGYVADTEYETMDVWCEYLASRGIVAFNPRFRLVTTPGVTWRETYADAIAAVRFATTDGPRFGADPNRIATLGRSSGGNLALIAGMVQDSKSFGPAGDPFVPVRVRAIVDFFGPTDYARFFSADQFSFLSTEATSVIFGGTPYQVPEAYALTSAFTYVRRGLPATMFVHGELDLVVPISHARDLANALEAAGNTVERAFYPDLSHSLGWGLFNNDGFGRSMIRVVRFLEKHL